MKQKLIVALCVIASVGFATNLNALESTGKTIYGGDIPKDKIGDYIYVGDEVITDAYVDLTKAKANDLKVTLEKDGFTKVTLRSYLVKTGVETAKIEEKFESYEKAMEYIDSLEKEGYRITNVEFKNDTEIKSSDLNLTCDTISDAQKAIDDFKSEYGDNFSYVIRVNKTKEEIETTEGKTSYKTIELAETALNEFIENNETETFYFTGEVVGPKADGTYTKSEINKHFDSKEAALAYLEELEKQGYEILNYEFINDTEDQERSLEGVYETKELAETAVNDFISKYKVTKEASYEKIHDASEDVEEAFSGTFITELAAQNFLNNKLSLQSEDVDVTGDYKERTVAGDTVTINETYETKELAEAAKKALSIKYDVVEDAIINEKEAGTVNEINRITAYNTQYVVENTTYILTKHGKEFHAWTMEQLDSAAQAQFKKTMRELDNVQNTGINIDAITFVYGENAYESDNKKPFKFIKDGDRLLVKMSPGSVSYIVMGTFVPVSEFNLVAHVHNNSSLWDVLGSVTTKGYDYKASIYGTENVTLLSGTLKGEKQIENKGYFFNTTKLRKNYTAKARGSRTDTLDSGTLTADTEKDVYEERYAIDLTRKMYTLKPIEEKEENPKTGDNTGWAFTSGIISLIGGLACIECLRRKEESK